MDATVKRIVISGYYGFHNNGDEAVLQSILFALQEQGPLHGIRFEPVVLSQRPEWTENRYGVKAVHRMRPGEVFRAISRSDALISGGGSLLQDVTGWRTIPYYLGIVRLAQWLGKPTFIYSQGIGPVRRSIFPPFIRSVFRRAAYISVRDGESADLLVRFGIPASRVEVVPDPVLGLSPDLGDDGKAWRDFDEDKPLIGISVRFWNGDRSDLDGLAEALKQIRRKRAVRFRFLPFHLPWDKEASLYVMKQLGLPIGEADLVRDDLSPLQMLDQVGECGLLIGMRLHSLIYAAVRRVPMVGFSYDPKIDRFLEQLKMKSASHVRDVEPEAIAGEALRLLDNRRQWIEEKESEIERLKKQAQRPAQQISALMRLKG